MSEERCEACKFWKLDEHSCDSDEPTGNKVGYCRRNPPQVVSAFFEMRRQVNADDPDLDQEYNVPPNPGEAWFPRTWDLSWCGEYRPIGAKSDVERIEEACSEVVRSVEHLHRMVDG